MSAFVTLKARYCVAVLVLAWYIQPGIGVLLDAVEPEHWYWGVLLSLYYADLVIAAFIAIAFSWARLDLKGLLGRSPAATDLPIVLMMTLFLYAVASALLILALSALSFVLPDFVVWWMDWMWSDG